MIVSSIGLYIEKYVYVRMNILNFMLVCAYTYVYDFHMWRVCIYIFNHGREQGIFIIHYEIQTIVISYCFVVFLFVDCL